MQHTSYFPFLRLSPVLVALGFVVFEPLAGTPSDAEGSSSKIS